MIIYNNKKVIPITSGGVKDYGKETFKSLGRSKNTGV